MLGTHPHPHIHTHTPTHPHPHIQTLTHLHPHTHYCITSHHLVFPSDAYKLAEATYSSTLYHRKKADTIRNALAVLQKYRFLFNLPRSIERSISNVRVGKERNRLGHCRGLYVTRGRGNGVCVYADGKTRKGERDTGGGGERERWEKTIGWQVWLSMERGVTYDAM